MQIATIKLKPVYVVLNQLVSFFDSLTAHSVVTDSEADIH